ncbi:MAG: helix-turn-helix domain-containing protein [Caldilineaceae bacterium]
MNTSSAPETASGNDFGAFLRQLRRRAGLSQTDVAVQVHLSVGQISRLESGARLPDPDIVATLFCARAAPGRCAPSGAPPDRAGSRGGAHVPATTAAAAATLQTTQGTPSEDERQPVRAARLFGRADTVDQACKRLLEADVRLLTLIGPPGVGKTHWR